MPRIAKYAVLILAILVSIAIFAPYFVGIYLKNHYSQVISYYNSFEGIQAESVSYQRGWFSSDAVLSVHIKNPDYLSWFNQMGIESEFVPDSYTIYQHIEHGPIFYSNTIPAKVGIAAFDNQIESNAQVKKLFDRLDVQSNFIRSFQQWINFNGSIANAVHLDKVTIWFPEAQAYLTLGESKGKIQFTPGKNALQGEWFIYDAKIISNGDSMLFPKLQYQFDFYPSEEGLWLGTSYLSVPTISAQEISGISAKVEGLQYESETTITAGKYQSSRKIDLSHFQWNDQIFGPVHVEGSVDKLNASALAGMIQAYQLITERGELYPSQLEQKMFAMFPDLINQGSSIKIDNIEIVTEDGKLKLNGDMRWTMINAAIPDELPDLLQSADAEVDMQVSKSFLTNLIHFYVTSPFINDASSSLSVKEAEDATNDIYFHMQAHEILIDDLVNTGQLREGDGMIFYDLEKNMVPIAEYEDQVRQLLWDKFLTRESSYLLYWAYLGIENSIISLENKIRANQKQGEEFLQEQVNQLVKDGYVTEDKDTYFVNFKQQNGDIKLNDKLFQK